MPRQNQKSITVDAELFNGLKSAWDKKKGELIVKENIATVTGYAKWLIQRGIQEVQIEQEGRFEIVNHADNSIDVRDYFLARDAQVTIAVDGPYAVLRCNLDNTGKCPHVGFVLSDPGVVDTAKRRGLTLRRAPKSPSISQAIEYFKKFAGTDEISDSDFIEKVRNESGMDEVEAKELLKALYQYGDIRKTRVAGGKYYFVATDEMYAVRTS